MLWGDTDPRRYIREALVCAAHLQTYCRARRILFLCPDIASHIAVAVSLLGLIWEIRSCEHLSTTYVLQKHAHERLTKVWSKLQLFNLLADEFDLCVIMTRTPWPSRALTTSSISMPQQHCGEDTERTCQGSLGQEQRMTILLQVVSRWEASTVESSS